MMSDRKLTPNFRRHNFATSMSLQSTEEEQQQEEHCRQQQQSGEDYPLFTANQYPAVALRMQSSFDTSSRELLQDDELLSMNARLMSVDEPDEEEEALDNFEMGTPNESRNDLEILSPIKLSMLSTQLLSTVKAATPPGGCGQGLVSVGNNVLSSSLKGQKSDYCDRGGEGAGVVNEGTALVGQRRPRKMVEFANFEDNANVKQKRTDSAGGGTDAAIQAKIFSEIKK